MKFTLRQKLVALSGSIAIVLSASSFLIMEWVANQQKSKYLSEFSSAAGTIGDSLGAQFFERYGDIQAFAINPDLRKDRKTAIGTLNSLVALYGIYDLVFVVDAKGRLAAVNDRGPDGKAIPVEKLYGRDFSKETWFQSVLKGEYTEDKLKNFAGTFVEDLHHDPLVSEVFGGKRLGNSFSAPIRDEEGKVIGVVSNRAGSRWVDFEFKNWLKSAKSQGKTAASIALVNRDGLLVSHYFQSKKENDVVVEGGSESDVLTYDFKKRENEELGSLLEKRVPAAIESENTQSHQKELVGYAPVSGDKFIDAIGWSVYVRQSSEEALAILAKGRLTFYIVFGIMSVLALLAGFLYSRQISNQLALLAERLGSGSNKLSVAANEISASSESISNAATQQAAAIQETAAAIEEVSAMVRKSAENARLSKNSSQESARASETGRESVQKMIGAVDEIKTGNEMIMNQVTDGNKRIGEIVKVIGEISEKTKVINDIVFQTKLLSFNASVEAARAGEHGKGFAVVAEEVGNLAQMSGNAAKEISTMLDSSLARVRAIVDETAKSVELLIADAKTKVDQGKTVSEDCGKTLEEITKSVRTVDSMVQEISQATLEQSQGVAEINKAIAELDQTTQSNAAVARESSHSADTLNRQSAVLQAVVDDLVGLVFGSNGPKAKIDQPDQPIKTKSGKEMGEDSHLIPVKPSHLPGTNAHGDSVPDTDDPRFEDVA